MNLKNKKIFNLLLIILTIAVLFLGNSVLAQEEATAEDEVNPATTEALKDRIEKAVEEQTDNTGYTTTASQTKRGFVGRVERVSEEAITLSTNKGPHIVPLNDQPQLIKNNKTLAVKDISIEDSALILGYQEKDAFTPMKILILTQDYAPQAQLVAVGSLTSIDTKTITLTSRKDNQELQIVVNSNTQYLDGDDNAISKNDLFEDMQIIVVGQIDVDEDDQSATNTALIVKSLVKNE